MKSKLLWILSGPILMLSFMVALPAAAFSGLEFNIRDDVTDQPWGTVDGQKYRIIVVDGSTVTYNSGLVTTPTAPPLGFTCDFGVPCSSLPLGNRTIPTPTIGNEVTIYIIMEGTTANPSTMSFNFNYFGDFGSPYTMNGLTGTGPTAVTLKSNQAGVADSLPVAALSLTLIWTVLTIWVLYARNNFHHFKKPRFRKFYRY